MKSKSSFIYKSGVLAANCLFLLAETIFLTFVFLDGGGEVVFCHNVIFSPAYRSCRETVEQFYIPLLVFSGAIAIMAICILVYTVFSSPMNKASFKKFLKFFIPGAVLLLLLGLIPIEVGLGFLGSATIFLFLPFLFIVSLIFVTSIYYFVLSKKRSILKYLFVVIVASSVLTTGHFYLMSFLESIAHHDRDLDNNQEGNCNKFWYERYKERCLEKNYKRSLKNYQ